MPLTRWRLSRERTRQKQKALHMLALSGVVRPSHVELRYSIPILKVGASLQSAPIPTAPHQSPQPQEPSVTIGTTDSQLLHWIRLTGALPKRLATPWVGTAEG